MNRVTTTHYSLLKSMTIYNCYDSPDGSDRCALVDVEFPFSPYSASQEGCVGIEFKGSRCEAGRHGHGPWGGSRRFEVPVTYEFASLKAKMRHSFLPQNRNGEPDSTS